MTFYTIFSTTIHVALEAIMFGMLFRAIFSMFFQGEENRISTFLTMITEPFIVPMRYICAKLNIFQDIPLDIPFLLTYLLLSFLTIVL